MMNIWLKGYGNNLGGQTAMTVFYFTATGNCLYAAKRIGGKLLSIPQVMRGDGFTFEDDVIGIVFPCYGFGMPHIVKRFLEKAVLRADYIFAVTTYGNKTAAALQNMEQFAAKFNIRFDYMNSLLMVDNYLPGYKMENQLEALPEKDVDGQLRRIIEDISIRKKFKPVPTKAEKVFTVLIQSGSGLMGGKADKKFIITSACNTCKTCAKVCPVQNISVSETVEYLHHCEGCLACIHLCPQNAIHLKSEKSTMRFRNENVTLREIIEANSENKTT